MTAELTCLNCGEAVRSADRFCSQCGDELTLSSHPTTLLPGEANPEDDPESPWAEVVLRLRRATAGEFESAVNALQAELDAMRVQGRCLLG